MLFRSGVIYIMLLAITRIPALPDFAVISAVSMILSTLMTFTITCAYKEKLKIADKPSISEIATAGIKNNALRLILLAAAGGVAAIAFSVTGSIYLVFTGLKILLATVSAFLVSIVATPALWTVFKKIKSGK